MSKKTESTTETNDLAEEIERAIKEGPIMTETEENFEGRTEEEVENMGNTEDQNIPVEDAPSEEVVESAETKEQEEPAESEQASVKKPRKKKAADPKPKTTAEKPDDRKIISQSGKKRVVTESDRYKAALITLLNSARSGIILTGMIEGVETYQSGLIVAVLHNGPFKVIIPAKELVEKYPDYKESMGYKSESDMIRIMVGKRIGAEVDYMVRGEVNTESDVAIASRNEAMKRIRAAKYLHVDPQGKRYMYKGAIAEARVQAVVRSGIIVEVQGVETFIPIEELSYTRCKDANELFGVGDIKPVKITDIIIDSKTEAITIKASVKAAEENPLTRLLPQLQIGGMYGGTVTMITTYGVFVQLDNTCECLCRYPSFGNEPVSGSRVIVKLTDINTKQMRIMGTLAQVRV